MPNETVFNQNGQPLYTEQVNTYIAPGIGTLPEAGAAMSGLLFGIPFASTAGTSTPLVMQVANPGGSGRTLYISRIIASTGTASVTLTLLRNATVGGTAVTPVNYNFGSAVTSVSTARTATAAPTGSPATLMSMQLAIGPVILNMDGRIILPPGNSLTLSVTIASGSTAATGNISWWEF